MRFAEFTLFLLPLGVFVLWRIMAPAGTPPKYLVFSILASVLAMGALLFTLRYQDAAPADASYVPARQENGQIVPSRVDRSTPQGRSSR